MKTLFTLLLSLILLLPHALPAQENPALAERLDKILATHRVTERTRVSVYVRDLKTGNILYDRFGRQLFTPASVLKTYTSACALDTFGPDKRWETRLEARGPITDGVLHGDLVLVAGGDPMFDNADLAALAARVRSELGITEILGSVGIDTSLFASPLKGPGWMWDDDPDTYNMSISAIMMDYNVLTAKITAPQSETEGATISFLPRMKQPFVTLDTTIAKGADPVKVTRAPFTEVFVAEGTIKPGDAETSQALTMQHPADWIRQVLLADLQTAGVKVADEGNASAAPSAGSTVKTLTLPSRPLAEMIMRFNKKSENAIGEMLLHQIALAGGTKPATWPGGAAAITKWLQEKPGLSPEDFRIVDGSGLSRYNLICAEGTVKLLSWMAGHKDFDLYKSSFPVYTVTLKDGTKAERVFAKPGGMAAVSTLAGYVQTTNGDTLIFAIFANGYLGDNDGVVDLRKKLLDELATAGE
jgi:D-alanyl-D-alanine carboxypeptidase/D-alanyl-D-alanine-endopeptidase (penicillin-binding protein 4)